MQLIIGALIFAVGAFFGAVLYAAGQKMQGDRKQQLIKNKFQDAILKSLEKNHE